MQAIRTKYPSKIPVSHYVEMFLFLYVINLLLGLYCLSVDNMMSENSFREMVDSAIA